MIIKYRDVVICLLFSVLAGCGGSSEKEPNPQPIIEEPRPESPRTDSQRVTLRWSAPLSRMDGSSLKMGELSHYKIVYGQVDDPDSMKYSVRINDASVESSMSHQITLLAPGEWFFAIKTIDQQGLESPFSEVVSKVIE